MGLFKVAVCPVFGLSFVLLVVTAKPAVTQNLNLNSFGEKNSVNASDIQFLLYTQENPDTPDQLFPRNRSSILSSHFVYGGAIKVVIHGYQGSAQNGWVQAMKDAYLATGNNYNVILVDWGKLCRADFAEFSTIMNIYVTGKYTAIILDDLVQANVADLAKSHIIGHSFGSHVAGFTANLVRTGSIPRITGLDSAKPYFDTFGDDARLDPTDAKTVDMIHSAGGIVGFQEPRGTVDFYPNGGQEQPGCGFLMLGIQCNHMRATDFFVESIGNPQAFKSCKCKDYDAYKRSDCQCAESVKMGEYVDLNAQGSYYLQTNSKSPFTR